MVFKKEQVIGSGPLDGSSTENVHNSPVAVSAICITLFISGNVGGCKYIKTFMFIKHFTEMITT